jgi:RHS repeat-associated protein
MKVRLLSLSKVPVRDVKQKDHYYPFGLNISALSSTAPLSKPNNFKYNGNEEQTDFDLGLYDFNARFYDPALGRFTGVDALADHPNQVQQSPYQYSWNNPINLNDPSGNCPTCPGFDYLLRGIMIVDNFINNASGSAQRLAYRTSGQISTEMSSNMSKSEQQMFTLTSQVNDANTVATETTVAALETGKLGAQMTQDAGEAIEIAGIVTGQPVIAGAGEIISTAGAVVEGAINLAEGNLDYGQTAYEVGKKVVFGSMSKAGDKAVKTGPANSNGDRNLGKQANNNWKGFVKGFEKLTDFARDQVRTKTEGINENN